MDSKITVTLVDDQWFWLTAPRPGSGTPLALNCDKWPHPPGHSSANPANQALTAFQSPLFRPAFGRCANSKRVQPSGFRTRFRHNPPRLTKSLFIIDKQPERRLARGLL